MPSSFHDALVSLTFLHTQHIPSPSTLEPLGRSRKLSCSGSLHKPASTCWTVIAWSSVLIDRHVLAAPPPHLYPWINQCFPLHTSHHPILRRTCSCNFCDLWLTTHDDRCRFNTPMAGPPAYMEIDDISSQVASVGFNKYDAPRLRR